jgi:ferredoxin
VVVDVERCCGSGQCTLRVPEVFDQRDEDGLVALVEEFPAEELLPELYEAEDRCPSQAIEILRQDLTK